MKRLLLLLLATITITTPTLQANNSNASDKSNENYTSEIPSFVGMKVCSTEWPSWTDEWMEQEDPMGFYSVSGLEDSMLSPLIFNTGVGAFDGNKYHIYQSTNLLCWDTVMDIYDVNTWLNEYHYYADEHSHGNILKLILISCAYDPTTGDIYGLFYGDGAYLELAVIIADQDNPVPVRHSDVVINIPSMTSLRNLCFDNQGNLYAQLFHYETNVENGKDYEFCGSIDLVRIDRRTGEVSTVGYTGKIGDNISNINNLMYCDHTTGKLYSIFHRYSIDSGQYDMTSELCEIDPETGTATDLLVYPDGRAYAGMYNPTPRWNNDAPAQCTNMEVNIPEYSETGTVTLVTPTKLSSGRPVPDHYRNLEVAVKVDGKTVGSVTAVPGEQVEIPIDLSAITPGTYTVTAVASNTCGEGIPTRVRNVAYTGTSVGIESAITAPALSVRAANGAIRITGNGYASITDLNGRAIFCGDITGNATIDVQAGIYVVTTPTKRHKVAVMR